MMKCRIFNFIFFIVVLFLIFPASSIASDSFMLVPDVFGPAIEDNRYGWTKLVSYNLSADYLIVTSVVDILTPYFNEMQCRGQIIPSIRLEIAQSGGDKQVFMSYLFKGVSITSIESVYNGSMSNPIERISFSYEQSEELYEISQPTAISKIRESCGQYTYCAEIETKTQEPTNICDYFVNDFGIKIGGRLPIYVPYSDEKFNVYTQDGELIGRIMLNNRQLAIVDCCVAFEDYTYEIYVDSLQTLQDIDESESRSAELLKKMSQDEISIEGKTFFKRVKMVFTKPVLRIFSFFS